MRLLIENKHSRINNSLLQNFRITNYWGDLSVALRDVTLLQDQQVPTAVTGGL